MADSLAEGSINAWLTRLTNLVRWLSASTSPTTLSSSDMELRNKQHYLVDALGSRRLRFADLKKFGKVLLRGSRQHGFPLRPIVGLVEL